MENSNFRVERYDTNESPSVLIDLIFMRIRLKLSKLTELNELLKVELVK